MQNANSRSYLFFAINCIRVFIITVHRLRLHHRFYMRRKRLLTCGCNPHMSFRDDGHLASKSRVCPGRRLSVLFSLLVARSLIKGNLRRRNPLIFNGSGCFCFMPSPLIVSLHTHTHTHTELVAQQRGENLQKVRAICHRQQRRRLKLTAVIEIIVSCVSSISQLLAFHLFITG